MHVVGCFVFGLDGRFIILRRSLLTSQPNRWGLPAGKREVGETETSALVREVFEETDIAIDAREVQKIGTQRFGTGEKEYQFITFATQINHDSTIILNKREHSEFRWVAFEECRAMENLISGFDKVLELEGELQRFLAAK